MPNKIKIMIIEDEDAISNFIATTLRQMPMRLCLQKQQDRHFP